VGKIKAFLLTELLQQYASSNNFLEPLRLSLASPPLLNFSWILIRASRLIKSKFVLFLCFKKGSSRKCDLLGLPSGGGSRRAEGNKVAADNGPSWKRRHGFIDAKAAVGRSVSRGFEEIDAPQVQSLYTN
jgi:hypothetical protein